MPSVCSQTHMSRASIRPSTLFDRLNSRSDGPQQLEGLHPCWLRAREYFGELPTAQIRPIAANRTNAQEYFCPEGKRGSSHVL
jgi:hypothetical protein